MTRPTLMLMVSLAFSLLILSPALADPPTIANISPIGVQRGVSTDVTISGSNLGGNPKLLAAIDFKLENAPNSDGGNFRFKLDVPSSVPVGVYPVRVKTDDGLSNPFLLAVGQVPQVMEKEENSVFETAQNVPSPVVVEGQVGGSDVDYFRFAGKKGQRIVVDAQCSRIGSSVDPQIRLTNAAKKFIEAADDSPGLLTDALLSAVLPEDGDYVVEISDSKYQGGARPIYRLVIGPIPVATEIYPIGGRRGETVGFELRGGTLPERKVAAATVVAPPLAERFHLRIPGTIAGLNETPFDVEILSPIDVGDLPEIREPADPAASPPKAAAPVVFNGRIDPPGDEDRFVLSVTPGQALRIRVDASELGSALDGTMQILDSGGKVLAAAEDTVVAPAATKGQKKTPGMISPDPSLDFTVPAGVTEITLALRDLIHRGGVGFPYRIVVEPIVPAFQLGLNESQANIAKGNTVALGVTLQRQGYNDAVTLSITDPPPGLTFRSTTIPGGQVAGVLTVSADKEATFGPVDLKVIGTGKGPSGLIVSLGSKMLVFAQQGPLPTNTITQVGLPACASQPLPVSLDSPTGPVELVHGYGGTIPLKVIRASGADGALTLASLPLPPNMAASGTISEKAAEGTATITAPVEAPLGQNLVVLTAKGTFGGKAISLVAPVVTFDVVRPAAVELATPSIEVKAGANVEVKGKIVRKGPFKEPVKVSLTGLPAGLKAEPVNLAPESSEFTIKIDADGGAAAAMANAQVAIAFQINKKDYPTPPTTFAVKVTK